MRVPPAVLLSVLLLFGCAPRDRVYGGLGREAPVLREFGPGFKPPLSAETGRPVTGFGGGGGGVDRVPVIFVHGNTVGPDYWLPARAQFRAAGYTDDELWAVGYGFESVRAFDNATLSAGTLQRFVLSVENALAEKTGRRIERFDIVAHSLGVTVVRQWLKQTNSFHKVRAFVGIAGANHGVWTARADPRGANRVVSWELYPGSPWLTELNAGGETPGPTHYYTLYDGSGRGDVLYPPPMQDSSALQGAINLAINRVRGSYYDHLQLARASEPIAQVIDWLAKERQPLEGGLPPPQILRVGHRLGSDQADARLHCVSGDDEPSHATAGVVDYELPAGISSCFAHNPRTALASPMRRYLRQDGAPSSAPLRLMADRRAGRYEQMQQVHLSASEPDVLITYTSTGDAPEPGSPRYRGAIAVTGPLTLRARAYAADGRVSAPLVLRYDVSNDVIDSRRAWARQLDPTLPAVPAPDHRGW